MGAELRFYRVAAMPNLQLVAKEWAAKHGGTFFPLGLDVPEAVSAIARTALEIAELVGHKPTEVWSAMSTGVLSRGLQVAFPNAQVYGVAVAGNIHAGERGRAEIYSHPKAFLQNVSPQAAPPYPSALNYDAKVWEYYLRHGTDGAWIWNVAGTMAVPPFARPLPKSDLAWFDTSQIDLS